MNKGQHRRIYSRHSFGKKHRRKRIDVVAQEMDREIAETMGKRRATINPNVSRKKGPLTVKEHLDFETVWEEKQKPKITCVDNQEFEQVKQAIGKMMEEIEQDDMDFINEILKGTNLKLKKEI
jgi:hypothetical protein